MNLCLLYLTCRDTAEAERIASALLRKKLVVCVKMTPVRSRFLWQGDLNSADEVLLIMDAPADNFAAVETEVARHHSYDTFVLTAVPVTRTTTAAEAWIRQETEAAL